jgi:histone H3/H4
MVTINLPLAPVEKILKKSNMRVSEDAVKEMALLLEEITVDIASEAVAISKRSNRRTVTRRDIEEARKKITG